jgi:hypothetical protein
MRDTSQEGLFDDPDEYTGWAKEWKDMPEFKQDNLMPVHRLIVNFESADDLRLFAKLMNQKITYKTR